MQLRATYSRGLKTPARKTVNTARYGIRPALRSASNRFSSSGSLHERRDVGVRTRLAPNGGDGGYLALQNRRATHEPIGSMTGRSFLADLIASPVGMPALYMSSKQPVVPARCAPAKQ